MPTRPGPRAPLGTVLAVPVALVLLLLTAFLVLHAPDTGGANREPASFDPSTPGPATTIQRD